MNTERLPEIVLGITLNNDHQVLIIQRAKEEKGTGNVTLSWAFPGGKVENDESKEKAVQRELLEETGYQIIVSSVISERQHPQFPVYVYYFECKLSSNIPVEESTDDEIKEVKWVNPTELGTYFTTDLDFKVAEHLGLRK